MALGGWQESVMSVVVKAADGTVLARHDSHKVLPQEGATEGVVSVAEHEYAIGSDPLFINSASHYSWGNTLDKRDSVNVTMKVLGSATDGGEPAALVRLDSFKLYVPDERFVLYRYDGGENTLPRKLSNYFTCDRVKHSDENGSYYLFTAIPGKGTYNNGSADERDSVSYSGLVWWRVENGPSGETYGSDRFLEAGHIYAAHDMALSCTTANNVSFGIQGPGSKFTTLPVSPSDTYGSSDYADYARYRDDTLQRDASKKKAVPGSSYDGVIFTQLYRYSGAGPGGELRGPDGKITEVYEFPYEVQPTSVSFLKGTDSDRHVSVDWVEYEIVSADGSSSTHRVNTKPASGYFPATNVDFVVPEGGRVAKVTVHYEFLWTGTTTVRNPYSPRFGYVVAETHENGKPLVSGELLQIRYENTWNETGKTFSSSVANADDYLWLEVEEERCPWLMDYRNRLQQDVWYSAPIDFRGTSDYVICTWLSLKGPAGGASRDYLDYPRLDLRMTSTRDGGFSGTEWIALLTGEMTLTKNLSGWKIEYGVYDEASRTERRGTYQIGELSGDTLLTRQMLGLSDTEYFTSFALTYDGRFTYKETRTSVQGKKLGTDQSPAGTYTYADLVKDVKIRPREFAFDGTRLLACTVSFEGVLSHGGSCDRPAHQDGIDLLFEVKG